MILFDKKAFRNFPSEEELVHVIVHTSLTVWDGELPKVDIERWLENFRGEVFPEKYERLLALWLLSQFTYYNKHEVSHLCRVVYRDLMHRLLTTTTSSLSLTEIASDFFSKTNLIPCEQMSGSSSFIAYFFRQANELSVKLFTFSLENVGPSIENLIIVDDVTLTGSVDSQLSIFLSNPANVSLLSGKNIYLVTLIASDKAIEFLEVEHGITVISAIILDERDKCFNSKSNVFTSFPNLRDMGREFAIHYGKRTPFVDPLGYKNGEYTFGFFIIHLTTLCRFFGAK